MANEDKREPRPEVERPQIERRCLTEAAIVIAPTAAVAANYWLNRPKREPPKQVELPPGVERGKTGARTGAHRL
jgi:hypothetical protein